MRLRKEDVRGILDAAQAVFGNDVIVRLFGSRTDDSKRGGDIDLHVTVRNTALTDTAYEVQFRKALEKNIGERKVDILIMAKDSTPSTIEKIALATGIILTL